MERRRPRPGARGRGVVWACTDAAARALELADTGSIWARVDTVAAPTAACASCLPHRLSKPQVGSLAADMQQGRKMRKKRSGQFCPKKMSWAKQQLEQWFYGYTVAKSNKIRAF